METSTVLLRVPLQLDIVWPTEYGWRVICAFLRYRGRLFFLIYLMELLYKFEDHCLRSRSLYILDPCEDRSIETLHTKTTKQNTSSFATSHCILSDVNCGVILVFVFYNYFQAKDLNNKQELIA